jgi:hypothetical protein
VRLETLSEDGDLLRRVQELSMEKSGFRLRHFPVTIDGALIGGTEVTAALRICRVTRP